MVQGAECTTKVRGQTSIQMELEQDVKVARYGMHPLPMAHLQSQNFPPTCRHPDEQMPREGGTGCNLTSSPFNFFFFKRWERGPLQFKSLPLFPYFLNRLNSAQSSLLFSIVWCKNLNGAQVISGKPCTRHRQRG